MNNHEGIVGIVFSYQGRTEIVILFWSNKSINSQIFAESNFWQNTTTKYNFFNDNKGVWTVNIIYTKPQH